MPAERAYRDPEITALTTQIHDLTRHIRVLVTQIDQTVVALETYAGKDETKDDPK